MGLNRARLSEIANDALTTLKSRPRFTILAACLAVLLASAWGTQRFADGLLSSIPSANGPDSPAPMTEEQIQSEILQAQRINDELRANRGAETYYYQQSEGSVAPLAGEAQPAPDGALPITPEPAVASAAPGNVPDPNVYVGTDEAAEPIYTVKPTYPEIARQSGTEGTVVIQALVGTDGRVRETRVLRSIPVLNETAQEAVRQWRFKPATTGGTPVATWVSVPVTFRH